jgi:hypothetical protein
MPRPTRMNPHSQWERLRTTGVFPKSPKPRQACQLPSRCGDSGKTPISSAPCKIAEVQIPEPGKNRQCAIPAVFIDSPPSFSSGHLIREFSEGACRVRGRTESYIFWNSFSSDISHSPGSACGGVMAPAPPIPVGPIRQYPRGTPSPTCAAGRGGTRRS